MVRDPAVQNWTTLIVDDEIDNRAVAERALTHYGARVVVADHGEDGLRLLDEMMQTAKPDFILLDISMPVMDGWQMLTRLRQNPATKDIPVIALTAHAMRGDDEKILGAGFDCYISKPFRLATLVRDIKVCLGLES